MTKSIIPKEEITLKPKTLLIILGILIGGGGVTGGGLAAFDFSTEKDVKEIVEKKAEEITSVDNARHVKIDQTFKKQGQAIQQLKTGVEGIQDTQIREIARTEARRLTKHIQDRVTREAQYDRLFVRNIKRLEAGRDPCSNLACD
jgi:hypothetical protein